MSQLKREVRYTPGFDCIRFECRHGSKECKPNAGGSHGRHGLQITWLVIGEKGAIQFCLYTGWLPEPSDRSTAPTRPLPADLGYHSPKPMYDGQKPRDCDIIGCQCYYDGTSIGADEPFRVLCNDGDEALWQYLESVYRSRFDGEAYPKETPYSVARREPS